MFRPKRCMSVWNGTLYRMIGSCHALQYPKCRYLVTSLGQTSQANLDQNTFYATTPIYYVNAQPHLGHLYTSVLAECIVNYHKQDDRLKSNATLFCSGTDEHGRKVEEAAKCANIPPKEFVDKVSGTFRDMNSDFDIQIDDFIRTSDLRHKIVVRWIWRKLIESGYIYLGSFSGWYCQSDEAFLTDSQVCTRREFYEERGKTFTPNSKEQEFDIVSMESGHPVNYLEERNYMFRLSAFQKQIEYILRYDPLNPETHNSEYSNLGHDLKFPFIYPKHRGDAEYAFVSGGLQDISVSRRRSNVAWAIPVPRIPDQLGSRVSEEHSIYVWVDALSNYLTVAAKGSKWMENLEKVMKERDYENFVKSKTLNNSSLTSDTGVQLDADIEFISSNSLDLPITSDWTSLFPKWPASVHVLGKDITRFHGVIWPAILMAVGLPLPRRLLVHGHWTVDGRKMSKSLGNVVYPKRLLQPEGLFISDSVKFFLLREGRVPLDAEFNQEILFHRCVKDCSDNFGNMGTRLFDRQFMPFATPTIIPGLPLQLSEEVKAEVPNMHPFFVDPSKSFVRSLTGEKEVSFSPHRLYPLQSSPDVQNLVISDEGIELLRTLQGLRDHCASAYESCEPSDALEAVTYAMKLTNRVWDSYKPWLLRPSKDLLALFSDHIKSGGDPRAVELPKAQLELAACLYLMLESFRICGILMSPAVPTVGKKIVNRTRQGQNDMGSWHSAVPGIIAPESYESLDVDSKFILFPKSATSTGKNLMLSDLFSPVVSTSASVLDCTTTAAVSSKHVGEQLNNSENAEKYNAPQGLSKTEMKRIQKRENEQRRIKVESEKSKCKELGLIWVHSSERIAFGMKPDEIGLTPELYDAAVARTSKGNGLKCSESVGADGARRQQGGGGNSTVPQQSCVDKSAFVGLSNVEIRQKVMQMAKKECAKCEVMGKEYLTDEVFFEMKI